MSINQNIRQVPITSPVKGVNTVVNREGQPPDTCWNALNMLPYDRYGRRRVSQRPGLTNPFPSFTAPGFIQNLTTVNNIYYPASFSGGGGGIGGGGFGFSGIIAAIPTQTVTPRGAGGATITQGPFTIASNGPFSLRVPFSFSLQNCIAFQAKILIGGSTYASLTMQSTNGVANGLNSVTDDVNASTLYTNASTQMATVGGYVQFLGMVNAGTNIGFSSIQVILSSPIVHSGPIRTGGISSSSSFGVPVSFSQNAPTLNAAGHPVSAGGSFG